MNTNDTQMIRSISWLSSGLVAIETGVVSDKLGWIFPLIVDGAIVVFSLSALRASLRKEKTLWLRGLVIFATCGSVCFNIAHVEARWLAGVLAATPPVLLFLSFEALMHSIQAEMQRVMESHETPKTKNGLEKEEVKKPTVKQKRGRSKKTERLAKVKRLKEQGMTPSEIVGQLENVSLRTVQRDLADLETVEKEAE